MPLPFARVRRALALLLAVTGPLTAGAASDGPPVAQVRPVTDTYFGTEVADPYRYFENLADPDVQAWMKAQAAYTRAVLDSLPGRKALQERIHALGHLDTRRAGFVRRGERHFYELVEPGAEQPKLVWREGLGGEEHLLFDPAAQGGRPRSVDFYYPSWDGKLIAYGVSEGGSEASVLRVMEVDTGRDLGERIERAWGSTVNWRADNRSFFYFKFAKLTPDTPPAETMFNARSHLHVVGRGPDGEADPAVFGRGVAQAVTVPEGEIAYVLGAPGSRWAVAVANHNADESPSTFFVAPMARVTGPATPWKRIAAVEDGVRSVALRGDTLYFLSNLGASRSRILATSLARPDVRHAKVVVPEGRGVITDFSLAADGLYYAEREGGNSRIGKVGWDGGRAQWLPMPFSGALEGPITDPARPGTLFRLQSASHAPQVFAYDPAASAVTDTGLVPPSRIDTSALETREAFATGDDGTRVPLTLVYRKGLVLDGSHPTILDGYGAYGLVPDSRFAAAELAWIERGGVIATAHVRGGGEYGEDWHRGGMMRTKLNTVTDFIACARWLIDARYTSPRFLVGTGTSAGGITIGRAMTLRPDLFGVVIDNVGVSDALRFETEPNGPPNTVEFGSVKTEEGFHGLYAMSPYAHVEPGAAYPAAMFLTGANDPRVAPWQMLKMAARTQAASSSGRPVLLRVDGDAGHGMGSSRSQREAQLADGWAFALWQMGDPDFQPHLDK